MPITEIALLRLLTNITHELRSKLAHAKQVMQDYTGRRMYFFQQTEDPALVYIIGEWDNIDQHLNHFLPTEQNQTTLQSLKGDIAIEWLLHVDVAHDELPLPKMEEMERGVSQGGGVISIVRHFVKDGEMVAFQQAFKASKHHLQDYLTEGRMGGGWRIDKEDGKEEWVLLCLYTSVQQHLDFAKTPEFERYGSIRDHIDGVEIKHAKLMDM